MSDYYLVDITFLKCKKGNETPGPQKNQEQEKANNVSATSFLHRSLPVWVMLNRFSMGVSGIHRFLFLIRTTTSHLQKVIQRSIKTDYVFAWLLFRWFFSSLLTSTNQGFPKFSKNLKAGDVSCLLAHVSTLTDRRQPRAQLRHIIKTRQKRDSKIREID